MELGNLLKTKLLPRIRIRKMRCIQTRTRREFLKQQILQDENFAFVSFFINCVEKRYTLGFLEKIWFIEIFK